MVGRKDKMDINEAILIMDGATRDDHLYMYDKEDRPCLIAQVENMALQALKELKVIREYIEPLRNFNTHNEHLEKLKELTK